jgi:regulator of sirC expression with transglutaminase-like and TPR domain
MYYIIIKALPDFQIALSDDQVFSTFAPHQLKYAVGELFRQLKKKLRLDAQQSAEDEKEDFFSMVHEDALFSNTIPEKLQEIFNEDARFN